LPAQTFQESQAKQHVDFWNKVAGVRCKLFRQLKRWVCDDALNAKRGFPFHQKVAARNAVRTSVGYKIGRNN
jgi:hypothetical protein